MGSADRPKCLICEQPLRRLTRIMFANKVGDLYPTEGQALAQLRMTSGANRIVHTKMRSNIDGSVWGISYNIEDEFGWRGENHFCSLNHAAEFGRQAVNAIRKGELKAVDDKAG